jgi:hypothetical protein
MAMIDYEQDDPYGGTTSTRTPAPTFDGFSAQGYQPSESPYPMAFGAPTTSPTSSYRPPSGNTGISGGIDPTNWAELFRGMFGGQQPGGGYPTNTLPQQNGGAFDFGAFQREAQSIGGRYSGSLDDFVNNVFPQLQQQFPGIQRFGSKGDKIRLPNGQVIDAPRRPRVSVEPGERRRWGVRRLQRRPTDLAVPAVRAAGDESADGATGHQSDPAGRDQ